MRKAAQDDPTSLILVIANMARSNPPIDGAFVAELARRLQGHGPALALPLTWFEQRLAQHEQPGSQLTSARAMFDLWIEVAEEAYAKVAISEPFQQVARWNR
ncbi:hypothetical protein G6F40_016672 [Rhizopus arrhizus]|nr:hypothetical protein G6F40_016672 [Rhizopus arrhizus]